MPKVAPHEFFLEIFCAVLVALTLDILDILHLKNIVELIVRHPDQNVVKSTEQKQFDKWKDGQSITFQAHMTESTELRKQIIATLGKFYAVDVKMPIQRSGRYFKIRNDDTISTNNLEESDAMSTEVSLPNRFGIFCRHGWLSRCGQTLAYAAVKNESFYIHTRDVATSTNFETDTLQLKGTSISLVWLEGVGFFYTDCFADGSQWIHVIHFHRMGTNAKDDLVVHSFGDDSLKETELVITSDSNYLLLSTFDAASPTYTRGNALACFDLSRFNARDASTVGPKLVIVQSLQYIFEYVGNDRNLFWLRTNHNAPNFKIVLGPLPLPLPSPDGQSTGPNAVMEQPVAGGEEAAHRTSLLGAEAVKEIEAKEGGAESSGSVDFIFPTVEWIPQDAQGAVLLKASLALETALVLVYMTNATHKVAPTYPHYHLRSPPLTLTLHPILAQPPSPSSSLLTFPLFSSPLVTLVPQVVLFDIIHRFDASGQLRQISELPHPPFGSILDINCEQGSSTILYKFSNFSDPGSVYKTTLVTTGKGDAFNMEFLFDVISQAPIAAPSIKLHEFETRQLFVESFDGQKVPVFVFGANDVFDTHPGPRPCILHVNGCFGAALVPKYSPAIMAFVHRFGGYFCVANVRGGGEKGSQWYRAGSGRNKETAVDDVLAVVEHLIEKEYTSQTEIAAMGEAAGAFVLASAINRRPWLFGAAVLENGFYDLLGDGSESLPPWEVNSPSSSSSSSSSVSSSSVADDELKIAAGCVSRGGGYAGTLWGQEFGVQPTVTTEGTSLTRNQPDANEGGGVGGGGTGGGGGGVEGVDEQRMQGGGQGESTTPRPSTSRSSSVNQAGGHGGVGHGGGGHGGKGGISAEDKRLRTLSPLHSVRIGEWPYPAMLLCVEEAHECESCITESSDTCCACRYVL